MSAGMLAYVAAIAAMAPPWVRRNARVRDPNVPDSKRPPHLRPDWRPDGWGDLKQARAAAKRRRRGRRYRRELRPVAPADHSREFDLLGDEEVPDVVG